MPKFETTNDLLDKAIALEKSAEDFYRHLAMMFAREAEVAKFWIGYADEERGHAAYLERLRGRLPAQVLSTPADATTLEIAERGLSRSIDSLLAHVKNLDDAYLMAIDLENSETNAVFDFILVNFPLEELSKSQAFLRIQLSKHVTAIESEFPSQYKSSMVRREIRPDGGSA